MRKREVENPSSLFLNDADRGSPGTAVLAGMEGTRPLLVEIQGLVAQSVLGTPRRAVVGWDPNRLSMLLAVLEARCGVRLGGHDVYLNVAGGLRLSEPAADLAVGIIEEEGRGILHLRKPLETHLKNTDLVRRSKAILDRAQNAEFVTA